MLAVQGNSDFFSEGLELLETFSANWGKYLMTLLKIILIILVSRLILLIISNITSRLIKRNKAMPEGKRNSRLESTLTLLRSSARYLVLFGVIVAILLLLGMERALDNFLSMAGIGALAIGFGAQSLVKDVVSGLFLNFENQFAVGDYVKFDDAEGVVEAMALRVTYVRSFKGDQIIVPNGSISRVINYSRGGSIAVVDIRTTYESNTKYILELLDHNLMLWAEEHSDMFLEEPKVLGITAFEESSVKIRVVCKSKPMMQWDVERSIRLLIKESFDAMEIRFAYPHMILHSEDKADAKDPNAANKHRKIKTDTASLRQKPLWQREQINLEGGDTDDY